MKTFGCGVVHLVAVCWLVQCFAVLTSGQIEVAGADDGEAPDLPKRTSRDVADLFDPRVIQTSVDTDILDYNEVRIVPQSRDTEEERDIMLFKAPHFKFKLYRVPIWPRVSCLVRCVPCWESTVLKFLCKNRADRRFVGSSI